MQFDAHRDVEPETGNRIDHGTMFSLALQDGVVDPTGSIQVGIRTCFKGEDAMGMKVLFADQVHDMSAPRLQTRYATGWLGPASSYLTFDIDFLDPATAPGTGTPFVGPPVIRPCPSFAP